MERKTTTINDLHIELFEYVFTFLPKVDMRTSTSVSHFWRDQLKQTSTYQSDEYKNLVGFEYVYALAECGYLDVLKWICQFDTPTLINKQLYLAAISGNHLHIVAWLQSLGIIPKKKAINQAITLNRIDILRMISPATITSRKLMKLMHLSVKYDHLDVLKTLQCLYPKTSKKLFWDENQNELFYILFNALVNDSLKVAEYCFQSFWSFNLNKAFTEDIYRSAIRECNAETYVWLTNKFASFGFIQHFSEEQIYYLLLDNINRNLMMWLYDNPTELINLRKFDLNIWKQGVRICYEVDSLQWLYDRGVKFDSEYYKDLSLVEINNDQYLAVLQWLCDKIGPDLSSCTINKIHVYGSDLKLTKWIHQHGFNCNINSFTARENLFGKNLNYKMIHWLCDPVIHSSHNCCPTCPGPKILTESARNAILREFNMGNYHMFDKYLKDKGLNYDFLNLYSLVFNIELSELLLIIRPVEEQRKMEQARRLKQFAKKPPVDKLFNFNYFMVSGHNFVNDTLPSNVGISGLAADVLNFTNSNVSIPNTSNVIIKSVSIFEDA
jgi:hypothetical protein